MASKVDDATSLIKQETDDEAEDDEPREAKRRKTEEEASAISDQKVPPKGDAPVVKVEGDDAYDKETDDEKEEESQEAIKPLQEEKSFSEDLAKWSEGVKKRVTKYAKAGGGRALCVAIMSKERFDFHMKSEGNDDELAEGLNMFSYEPYGNGRGLELSEKRGVDDLELGDCRAEALSLLKTETQNDSEDIKYTSDLSLYLIPGTAGEDWTEWSSGDWDLVVKEAESEIGPFPGPFTVSRLATIVKELEGIVFPSA